ncbi:Lipopolysaccharide heptosyltransferase 1 [Thalassocella blandensis]|nr:Lipopolysaccharide heptosyltransferase 1 [Thalassocella blandensis]
MKKILLIRLSAIGDVVMASGLLNAIKAKYPQAHITWLVEPAAAGLLKENTLVDQVVLWPKSDWQAMWREKRWGELWRTIRAFRQRLHSEQFDLSLDTQGIFKSAFLGWLSGAKRRVGVGKKEGSHLFHTETIPRVDEKPNMCSEYIDLAEYLGLNRKDYRMSVAFSSATEQQVKQLMQEEGLKGPYAVFCPFTTRPQKHWFDHHWLELTQTLRQRGYQLVMLGGPGDLEHANAIAAQGDVINLVGKTSLLGAAAVIDGSALLVGVDTGLTHIGIAREVPTVAIFGSTRPYLEPLNDAGRVIYEKLSCSPCRRHPTCGGEFTCMLNIDADKVIHVIDSIVPSDRTVRPSS